MQSKKTTARKDSKNGEFFDNHFRSSLGQKQTFLAATQKADMCAATRDVRPTCASSELLRQARKLLAEIK
jgi:hypothetical protein